MEAAISSVGVSEGCVILRILNGCSAEIGNTFRELMTAVEGTQTRATFGSAVSIEVVVSLVPEMENKYSGCLMFSIPKCSTCICNKQQCSVKHNSHMI